MIETLRQLDLAPVASVDEILVGVQAGALRKLTGDRRRARGSDGSRAEHWEEPVTWDQEIESTIAEIVTARVLDLPWSGLHFTPGEPGTDVGGNQVRWTHHNDGHLIVYESDRPKLHQPFILVTGRCPHYRIRGWLRGADATQGRYWREPPSVKCESWWVPIGDLEAMVELP